MKTLVVTREYLEMLVLNSLAEGHTMKEVHELLDKMNVVIKKGGK